MWINSITIIFPFHLVDQTKFRILFFIGVSREKCALILWPCVGAQKQFQFLLLAQLNEELNTGSISS